VELPRDVRDQVRDRRLVPVARGQLGPGDLLVFRGATHVGLARSAAEFIHATTAGRPVVQTTAVDSSPWSAILDGCFRVDPNPEMIR
jgi:cell wall-associated NlpC family hydrolase